MRGKKNKSQAFMTICTCIDIACFISNIAVVIYVLYLLWSGIGIEPILYFVLSLNVLGNLLDLFKEFVKLDKVRSIPQTIEGDDFCSKGERREKNYGGHD